MNKRETTEKKVLGVAYVLAAIILVAYIFLLSLIYIGRAKIKEVAVTQKRIDLQQSYALSLERSLRVSETKIEQLNEYAVYEEDVPEFIERLESLRHAFGAQMSISSISTDRDSLTVSLVVGGKYSNVLNLIKAFEKMPLRSEITSFALSSQGDKSVGTSLAVPATGQTNSAKNAWTANVKFKVFGFIPKEK